MGLCGTENTVNENNATRKLILSTDKQLFLYAPPRQKKHSWRNLILNIFLSQTLRKYLKIHPKYIEKVSKQTSPKASLTSQIEICPLKISNLLATPKSNVNQVARQQQDQVIN